MSDKMNQLLKDRESNYGNYHTLANLSQTLNKIINQHYTAVHSVEGQPAPQLPNFMAESVQMICQKIARIANGNIQHIDSWEDIAGYALRVVEILQEHERAQVEAAKAAEARRQAEEQATNDGIEDAVIVETKEGN